MPEKIDVMIIGAQKAGTTSLLRYFGEHPECVSHSQKEFAYFTDNREHEKGFDAALDKYYPAGTNGKKIVAKNSAIYVYEHGIRRLKEHNAACELVLILRNPVERTYSSYLMEKNHGDVSFRFSDVPALAGDPEHDPNKDYFECLVDYSLYAKHIRNILKHFPRKQLHLLFYEDLNNEPARLCHDLFGVLGMDRNFTPDVKVKHNETRRTRSSSYARVVNYFMHNNNPVKRTVKLFVRERNAYKYGEMLRGINATEEKYGSMDAGTRRKLVDYYRPFNRELEDLTGRDLSHWNN